MSKTAPTREQVTTWETNGLRRVLTLILEGEEWTDGTHRPWRVEQVAEILNVQYDSALDYFTRLVQYGLICLHRGQWIPTAEGRAVDMTRADFSEYKFFDYHSLT